jgi:VanZ family protein
MTLKISSLFIALVIGYMSLTPTTSISIGNDKLGHFLAYAVLMTNVGLLTFKRNLLFRVGIGFSLAYGLLMELGQCFVPGRTFSVYDLLANAIGVLIGVLVLTLFGDGILKITEGSPYNLGIFIVQF